MALTVISDNTTTTDGTEQTLATDTTNQVYVLVTDLNTMANGDTIELRLYTKVRSGGTEHLAYLATYNNVQGPPIKYSVPVPANISCKATLKKTAGVNQDIPWALLAL